jgi:AcrR family transcriptional regulator
MTALRDGDHDKAIRGRPRIDADRHVCEALMAAAADGLRVKSHRELTSREIASRAGTNQAMIKYYFDGKDGLFAALIESALKNVAAELDHFEATIAAHAARPTRDLLELLLGHYLSSASLYKIVIDEQGNEHSAIRRSYARRGCRTFLQLCRILRRFVSAGFYRPDTDIRAAAFMITCFIETPVSMAPMLGQMGFTLEELKGDAWIDRVSGMLEREFGA